MNRKILQKVIDALNAEKPDLSYVKGILETVMEGLPEEKTTRLERLQNGQSELNKIFDDAREVVGKDRVFTPSEDPIMAMERKVIVDLEKIKKMSGNV